MKKGFIFSIDSFFALLLFIFIITLLYGFFLNFNTSEQQFFFSEDLLTVFSEVKISELELSKYPNIDSMINNNQIKDTDFTIMEQIVLFQSESNNQLIKNLLDDLTEGQDNNLLGQYKFSIDIGGEVLYGETPEQTTSLISRHRIISGRESI